ncbi:MAG TPA: FecR domain-containing protein [Gemmatimonadaceae bacterium]|nr:FecR domain-containing protein [Gemmatimonadaceae bacterium]
MDEIIARALHGRATAREMGELEAWRAASAENERQYWETVRLLTALRDSGPRERLTPPRAADLIASVQRRRAHAAAVRSGARSRLPWGLAAAAVLALAVQLARSPSAPTVASDEAIPSAEIVTAEGELATVRLPDGSVARVGPRSRLRLMLTRHERTVWVEGQAFFAVAKDSSQPFRVRTDAGDLVALGTRFDVRTHEGGLRLAVLEGRVALLTRGERTEVGSGEAAGVQDGLRIPVVKFGDPANVTKWMKRFLAFQETPLQTAILDIERVYGRRVVLTDPALGSETITAMFTDQSLDQVVLVICTVTGLKCDVTSSQVTISR